MNEEEILRLVREANPDNPINYVHDIVSGYALEKMNSMINSCQDCPEICNGPRSLPYGNHNAYVMIIGESASGEEGEYPFGEEEHEILDKVFTNLNVNQNGIFIMNSISCWPYKQTGNELIKRTPNKKEVNNCIHFVNYAIDIVRPAVIILMGGIAINNFHRASVSECRGEWIEVKGIQTMPTYNPSYFLKVAGKKDEDTIDSQKWDFYCDIRRAFLYIEENYPNNTVLTGPIPRD